MIDISTRVLRAMVALDDLRHFSLAAERCHVTQSALSQMIGKLENTVDLRLIDRDRRRVSLTPEGERFVATARRVLLELEEISQDLKDHSSMRKGRVSISALPSLATHWLPPVIRQFRTTYPNIEVRLNDANPDRSFEQVRQRQVDFAITGSGPSMVGFQQRLLFDEPFVLVCHKSHKLSKSKRLKLEDLAGQEYIRLAHWGAVGGHLQKFLTTVPVLDTGFEVTQIATVAGLVKNNLGVSLVPRMAVHYFDRSEVVAIPLPDPDLTMPVYLIWRAASALSPAAAKFIEMLPDSDGLQTTKLRAAS
ncbi:MAG TPA: LysR family transcriptional regulator [Ramlibacter sp.]|nr:LysR family transcriptional regulator [Ramlibacter sp.]